MKWDNLNIRKYGNAIVILLLVGLPLLVFGSSLTFDFLRWDDDVNFLNNPHVATVGWPELQWMFTDVERAHRYLPLGWLSYALQLTIWGRDPFMFHAGNLLLHVGNTLLVFGLARRVLRRWSGAEGQGLETPRWLTAAGMGALIWALNPLRVEVVSWSSSRIYLMATLWFLLSLHAYLQSAEAGRARTKWLIASWAMFGASLLTYPVVLLGAVVFIALDLVVLRRWPENPQGKRWSGSIRSFWLEKIPYLTASGICLGVTVATRNTGLERSYLETLAMFDVPHRIMQGFYGWAYFLWKPWWPTDLAPKYGRLIEFDPMEGALVGSALFVLGITAVLLACAWRRRWRFWPEAACLWGIHLMLFLPLIGLTEYPHSLYDRYTYAPGILWALLVAGLIWKAWDRPLTRSVALVLSVVVVTCFSWMSRNQLGVWKNTATVRLRVAEALGKPLYRAEHEQVAGLYYLATGDYELARQCLEKAALHDPEDLDTFIYLGDAWLGLGRNQEAYRQYERVVGQEPKDLLTLHNLGVAFCKMGRFNEGVNVFRNLLTIDPGHENARHNLSLALKELSKTTEVIKAVDESKTGLGKQGGIEN